MKIRPCLLICVVFNCFIKYCDTVKTFSLNEAIAAESLQKSALSTPRFSSITTTSNAIKKNKLKSLRKTEPPSSKSKREGTHADRITINKIRNSSPFSRNNSNLLENIFRRGGTSPLIYRKTFQIKSPLRPKKLKYTQQSRYKRRNQSASYNDNQQYVPLLKNLRMLLDNLLDPDSDDVGIHGNELGHSEKRDNTCKCNGNEYSAPSNKEKETVTSASVFTPKIASPTSAQSAADPTHNPAHGYFGTLRKNKILPVLLARNSTSVRRNYNGFGKGSGATLHGGVQRNITRTDGDHECDTNKRTHVTSEEDHTKHTISSPRNNARGDGFFGKIRRASNNTRHKNNEINQSKESENSSGSNRRDVDEHQRENQLKIERIEPKNPIFVRQPEGRLRERVPENQVNDNTEFIQPKENNEEGNISVPITDTDDKRFFNRNGASSTEIQNIHPTFKAVMLTDVPFKTQPIDTSRNTSGVVIIIDGYSVARDKNGENTVAKKPVRFLR